MHSARPFLLSLYNSRALGLHHAPYPRSPHKRTDQPLVHSSLLFPVAIDDLEHPESCPFHRLSLQLKSASMPPATCFTPHASSSFP